MINSSGMTDEEEYQSMNDKINSLEKENKELIISVKRLTQANTDIKSKRNEQGIVKHLNAKIKYQKLKNNNLKKYKESSEEDIKALIARAENAEAALNPVKESLNALTAEKSRWLRRVKRNDQP
tara:strand:+ start:243 stop:614 length:372 start_codon:yes stop_codon:yes gene_type:complete